MERTNIKKLKLSIIAVLFLITIVGGATFAFFSSTQDINANLPANITTAGKTYSFIASSSGEIDFYLSAQDMVEANVSENYITADNGLINVEVASANDGETTLCTYDIAWVWDSADKYTESDVSLPYTKDGKAYPYELSVNVDGIEEKDLSSYTLDSNNSFIIATGLQTIATSTTPVINSHKIEVKAYNIPIDQQNLFNKNFRAHMEVRNINCGIYTKPVIKSVSGVSTPDYKSTFTINAIGNNIVKYKVTSDVYESSWRQCYNLTSNIEITDNIFKLNTPNCIEYNIFTIVAYDSLGNQSEPYEYKYVWYNTPSGNCATCIDN